MKILLVGFHCRRQTILDRNQALLRSLDSCLRDCRLRGGFKKVNDVYVMCFRGLASNPQVLQPFFPQLRFAGVSSFEWKQFPERWLPPAEFRVIYPALNKDRLQFRRESISRAFWTFLGIPKSPATWFRTSRTASQFISHQKLLWFSATHQSRIKRFI